MKYLVTAVFLCCSFFFFNIILFVYFSSLFMVLRVKQYIDLRCIWLRISYCPKKKRNTNFAPYLILSCFFLFVSFFFVLFCYFAFGSLSFSLYLAILYRLDLPSSHLANLQTNQILLFNRQSCADQLCIFSLHALLCKRQNMYSHLFCHAVALL